MQKSYTFTLQQIDEMQVIYNVTVKMESAIHDEWREWMLEKHIPDVMATGKFLSWKMVKLYGDEDEHGIGYAIQYTAANMEDFLSYQRDFSPALQREHALKYDGQYVAFRTVMDLIAEG